MTSQHPNQGIANRPSPPNMHGQTPQGQMFSQGQGQGQSRQPRPMLQNPGQINSPRMQSPFDQLTKGQGHLVGQNLSQGQIQFSPGQGQGIRSAFQQSPSGKENVSRQGDFPLMSGGDINNVSPSQVQGQPLRPPMFAQPPPNTVPPFPNFSNPPPDLSSSTLQQSSQQGQMAAGSGGFHGNQMANQANFSHAPGTERPQTGRPQNQDQGPLRHHVPVNQQGVSILAALKEWVL